MPNPLHALHVPILIALGLALGACGGDRFGGMSDPTPDSGVPGGDDSAGDDPAPDDSSSIDDATDDAVGNDDATPDDAAGGDDATDDAVGNDDATPDDAVSGDGATDDGVGNDDSTLDDAVGGDDATDDSAGNDDSAADDTANDDPADAGVDEDDPTADDSTADDSAVDDSTADDSTADDSAVDDSTADDSTADDSAVDDSTADDSPVVDPRDAGLTADDSGAGDSGSDAGTDASSELDASGVDAAVEEPEAAAPDECPNHPEQSVRGSCGCGFTSHPDCEVLENGLAHRYGFGGSGTVATDSIGAEHGTVVGTNLNGSGTLSLSGFGQYVDLPSGIVSALGNATFEAWVRWDGGDQWQRVFDFGSLSYSGGFGGFGGGGGESTPQTYLFLTVRSGGTTSANSLTASWTTNTSDDANYLRSGVTMPTGRFVHLAAVVDDTNNDLLLYLDGELIGDSFMLTQLSSIDDEFNRLGRSLHSDDPDLDGAFDEFRIYSIALTQAQIDKSIELGPDATFSAPADD